MTIGKGASCSAVEFRLDVASGVPSYLQIVRQVEDAIRLGYLVSGDQLPRVKDVVSSLAINPNTVLKAYRELEIKGLVVGRPGQGTFVSETVSVVPLADFASLRRKLTRWLGEAFAAGLDEAAVTALFSLTMHELRSARSGEVAS
jgi:GntR family transcriptional regulator